MMIRNLMQGDIINTRPTHLLALSQNHTEERRSLLVSTFNNKNINRLRIFFFGAKILVLFGCIWIEIRGKDKENGGQSSG
jgi:hypothetical protein